MPPPIEPLTPVILMVSTFGSIVFAISGALTAARYRMDLFGVALIGVITGIGGGTVRDLLLARPVFWIEDPLELTLCLGAALLTFFAVRGRTAREQGLVWADALGLAAFSVVGCNIALRMEAPFVVAVLMGILTATGGGIIRDLLTRTQPMILSGELYATAALAGALTYAGLVLAPVEREVAQLTAFAVAFALRAAAIVFHIRMGPPGELIRFGKE